MTKKILVIDDSLLIRRLISSAASVLSVECVGVSDGAKALEMLGAHPDDFSLVCLDWNMPNMGGLDLAKAVRAHPAGKHVPILMVTARSMREDIITALSSDVNSYIVKPFTPAILKEKIDALNSATPAATAA